MKRTKLVLGNNAGFTLMELLIVIVIMGFLLGMVVPRLASVISGDTVDTVCDSNNKGVRYYTKLYLDQKGRFPSDMTNLVNQTGATTYARPLIEDKDTDNGAETLALEFYQRNQPVLHTLDAAEAAELVSLGISYVRNLNDGTGSGHDANAPAGTHLAAQTAQTLHTTARPNQRATVAAGLGVLTIGDVANSATAGPQVWNAAYVAANDYPAGNPNWYGRIILGLGKDCGLVKDGYIQGAALCPGGVQNADNVVFNNYCIILPRLEATVARLDAAVSPNGGFTLVDSANTTNGEQLEFEVKAQEAWEFDFTCPEGHKWPDNDSDTWVLP